ncbi:hypothetical protein HanPSC8_Chr08g0310971 [Helianthus annuus]|nr:hypothetical protein HanPSC8_Chr08g0310971 [Helianthus annuus]
MDDNEWESIHPSSSDEDDGDTVVVLTNSTNPPVSPPTTHHNSPVFPQHPQDTHLQQPPPSPPSSHSSSTTPYGTEIVETESTQPPEVTDKTLFKAGYGVLSSWVLRIGYGVRSRIGFWSVVSVGVVAAVVAYARRWQRWQRLAERDYREKLLVLLKQKDEKIKQLLLQIERMNEALSVRRRVPVIRVVVDSPVVIGPRLN